MGKPLFSPFAGLIQDILLLSSIALFGIGLASLVLLRLWDYQIAKKRRKSMMGRTGQPLIQ